MYQILIHALTKPENKTKFKLIFANVSEKDILLKEELDALKKKYPQTFDVVYTVDAAGPGWNGGGVTPSVIDLRLTLFWKGPSATLLPN
jgi:cytochrome-b5 reductase